MFTFSVLILQTPLLITVSSSDVTHFLKTHDLAITTRQESLLFNMAESSMVFSACININFPLLIGIDAVLSDQLAEKNLQGIRNLSTLKEPQLKTDAIQTDLFAERSLEGDDNVL